MTMSILQDDNNNEMKKKTYNIPLKPSITYKVLMVCCMFFFHLIVIEKKNIQHTIYSMLILYSTRT